MVDLLDSFKNYQEVKGFSSHKAKTANSDILSSTPPIQGAQKADLAVAAQVLHDPKSMDWLEVPVTFREFCESTEHMNMLPKGWKKGHEGALSERQYKDALLMLGNDPIRMFDPKYRQYTFGALLWGKGCVGADTLLFDEITQQEYTAEFIVKNNLKIRIKCWDEKRNKVVIKDIADAFSKGNSKRFLVKLKSGKKIVVSEEHQFLTKEGWEKLKDLNVCKKIAIKKN